MDYYNIIFLTIFLTTFISLIFLCILFKGKTKITVAIAVIMSSQITGFIAGISNEPASTVLIPLISGFIAILLPLLLSNNVSQEDDRLKKRKIRYIASLLIIFLITLLPFYLSSNYLRFNCSNFLGLMGFGAPHCKDSLANITFNDFKTLKDTDSEKPKMAQIRCKYIGIKLIGCEKFLDYEDSLKKEFTNYPSDYTKKNNNN